MVRKRDMVYAVSRETSAGIRLSLASITKYLLIANGGEEVTSPPTKNLMESSNSVIHRPICSSPRSCFAGGCSLCPTGTPHSRRVGRKGTGQDLPDGTDLLQTGHQVRGGNRSTGASSERGETEEH